jgi:hypothetical protein
MKEETVLCPLCNTVHSLYDLPNVNIKEAIKSTSSASFKDLLNLIKDPQMEKKPELEMEDGRKIQILQLLSNEGYFRYA